MNSLNPKLWVSFPPWSGKESELFQAVLVASQPSCPAGMPEKPFSCASSGHPLRGDGCGKAAPWSQDAQPRACLYSAVQKLPAKRRHSWRTEAHFNDSVWCSMSDHTHLLKKHHHRPRTGHCSPETVTSFPYTNKGEPITAGTWLNSFGILNFALLAKRYCSNCSNFFLRFWTQITGYNSTYIHYTATTTHLLLCHTLFHQTDVYILNPLYWDEVSLWIWKHVSSVCSFTQGAGWSRAHTILK